MPKLLPKQIKTHSFFYGIVLLPLLKKFRGGKKKPNFEKFEKFRAPPPGTQNMSKTCTAISQVK
jgi:hypothetical protein